MRIVRWLGIIVGTLIAVIALLAIAARLSDGPIAIFAGG
jgi:hypothetical protein